MISSVKKLQMTSAALTTFQIVLARSGVVSLKKWIIEEVLLVVGLSVLAYGQIMGTTFYG